VPRPPLNASESQMSTAIVPTPTPTPSRKSRTPALVPAPQPALPHAALFGAPPLVAGEDAAAYDGLTARIAGGRVWSSCFVCFCRHCTGRRRLTSTRKSSNDACGSSARAIAA
jgi:hypothetical protein